MFLFLTLFTLSSGGGSTARSVPRWEKIYEARGTKEWLSSVWAEDRDNWFVAGDWGATSVTKTGTVRTETAGPNVLGLLGESANSVFGVGTAELILHFNGKSWVQEHIGSSTKGPLRGDHLLYSAFYFPDATESRLVAFGPRLALQRQRDATWTRPPRPEMARLSLLAEIGPPDRPARCDRDWWFWLGKNRAWFSCKDRRTFTYERGKTIPKGLKPVSCARVTRVAVEKGEVYAICAERTIWKTDGQTWGVLEPPSGSDREYRSISVAGGCVFLAGRRTVWRSCVP